MAKNRKKKNNQQKKKNNNNNSNNKKNQKTLEENEKLSAVTITTDTTDADATSSTVDANNISATTIVVATDVKSTQNTNNDCIDGNAPILNTTNEKNSTEEFACAISIAPSSTYKDDANIHEDIDHQNEDRHNDDVDVVDDVDDASTPTKHQSSVSSETTIIDNSILLNNYKTSDRTEIVNNLINNDNIIIANKNGSNNNNNNNTSCINSENDNKTDLIDEKSINLTIKTGSSSSKNAQLPGDNADVASVTLIRKENVDREMQTFKNLTIPELSSENVENSTENSISDATRDNQLSIQLKSVTYHLNSTDDENNKDVKDKDLIKKSDITKEISENSLKYAKNDKNVEISASDALKSDTEVCEEKQEPNFVDSLKKVYESEPKESPLKSENDKSSTDETEFEVALTTISPPTDKALSKDNDFQADVDETFSKIISEFDKLDEDIDSAFSELNKEEIKPEKIIKENDVVIVEKVQNSKFVEIKPEIEKADIKELNDPSQQDLEKINVIDSKENVVTVEKIIEDTFSEILADCDKLDEDIEQVFNEISKNGIEVKTDLEDLTISETASICSPVLSEKLGFTVTSPKSSNNNSDDNIKDKIIHFVTIEDISENDLKEKLKDKILDETDKKLKDYHVDNTVTIEDLNEDDDIVILSESDESKVPSKDYKTKKITKRIALQTHFLPQIIEPRYLDCIKEENSDLSDIEKRDDLDFVNSSFGTGGSFDDDLEDEVFYDNEIYQKANAVYPKIQLDFTKKKKKPIGLKYPHKADAICEEDVQTIVETKIIEQQSVEEGCSKRWSKNLTPTSEHAEIIYLNSASSSSSDILDSDSDTKDVKSPEAENADEDSETRIKTPIIDYIKDSHNQIIENLITPPDVSIEHKEIEQNDEKLQQQQQQEKIDPEEKQEQKNPPPSSPTSQSNKNINSNNNSGEISEKINENENNYSPSHNNNNNNNNKMKITDTTTLTNEIRLTSTPVSGINNNFMISEKSQLVSNEKLNTKEQNLAENFANQQQQLPPTFTSENLNFSDIIKNNNNTNKLIKTTTTTISKKSSTTTSSSLLNETTEKSTELSEQNINIHNNKINTNRMVNLTTNLSNLEEEIKSTAGNTAKGILRQESAESYCSAQSHSTVSSQCTAIRKGSPNPAEDNNTLPTKSLKQICLESLVSMPYGKDVLEELAAVSQSLEHITNKSEVRCMQAAKSEELLHNNNDMPYPLPEPPKTHNIEVKFELSHKNKNFSDIEVPPPLPKLPAELHKFGGPNLSNYKNYINELKNISTSYKTPTTEQSPLSTEIPVKSVNQTIHKISTAHDSNANNQYTQNIENHQESKYNITSSSEIRNNKTSTPPPPVPPLPSFKREINLVENFPNTKNSDSLNQNNHRLLEIIRNTSEQQQQPINENNSKMLSSEMKTEKKSTSTTTETKSETKNSSIFDDLKQQQPPSQFGQKIFDKKPSGQSFENDDIWRFLNDPNYFKASFEKFPTTDFDKIFSSETNLSATTQPPPPAVPKRYSNIETSSFESKKVYQNGKLVSEVQNTSHNDRIDENSLASMKKFISDGNLGDQDKWSLNNLKTFKNTSDATDSINKNAATDTSTNKQQQQTQTLPQQKTATTTTESRKSDEFSYDEFRQRAKERAENKAKSEIFNTEDIFKEFKRFSENLDRDIATKTNNLRSDYGANASINTPLKTENQQTKQQSSSSHFGNEKKFEDFFKTNTEKKETKIPVHIENEMTTKEETRTETVVKEELKEMKTPGSDKLKKEFNIPINFEQMKKTENISKEPPPPPHKTEHTIPVHFENLFEPTQQNKTRDSPMWTGTAREHATSNISKSQKEINIPIKVETKQEHWKTDTSSSTTNEQNSSTQTKNFSSQTDSKVPHEFKIPIKIANDLSRPTSAATNDRHEINIPIRMETGNKHFYKTDNETHLPRSAPSTDFSGFDIPIKVEPPNASAYSDDRRRRTYSSSVHEDMYRSDNTSDYWRSTENISSRNTPNLWRSSVDLSSRVSTPSIDKIVKPIEKEVDICLFGKSSKIKAPRLTASTSNLSYYMPSYTPEQYHPPEPYNYTAVPNRSTSRRKYYTSCQSMIEETPSTPYFNQPHFMHHNKNRTSVPKEMNPQFEYIRKREDELKKEYMVLEDEREKLLKDLTQFNETLEKEIYETQLQKNTENRKHLIEEMNNFHYNQRNQYQPRRRSWNLPSLSEEEALQQKMRNEWLNKIAEREDRRMHKVIKLTKPSDELTSTAKINQNTRKFSDSINIGDEFLRRVKERRTKLSMPADSDWESGAESQPAPSKDQQLFGQSTSDDYNVKIFENRSEADLKSLPKHLFEFAEFVKKFEEEHKDLGIFENDRKTTITNLSNSISNLSNGVWSPNNNEPFKVTSDINNQQNQQQQQQQQQQHHQLHNITPTPPPLPTLPAWSSQESPQLPRKFRPVKFESPTLPRKYVREGSGHVAPPWASDANKNFYKKQQQQQKHQQPFLTNGGSGLAGTQSFSCSSLNNFESNNCNKFNNNNFNTNINKFGSTSSLKGKENLQRVHSTGYIKPNEVVYSLKHEYLSEPEINSGHPKRMAQLAHRQIEGIGPTTKDGMPIVLRSEVKENNQHQWYKKMFQTLHKAKDHDGSIVIRYKSPKGRYSHKSNGYMSEPEPYYDSDYSSMKYRSVERKPRTISASSAQNERSYGTLSIPAKPVSESYKNQPGKIENFTPGHSSVSDKERKDWWDEVMDIFNGHWEQQKLSPHYSEGNLSRALKEHEYDSDSNIIFRKKQQNLQSPLSPVEQKQAYKSVQAGGEPPLLGFRKPAPEKPKDSDVAQSSVPSNNSYDENSSNINGKIPDGESPYRYYEGDVNIHYKTPIRYECKDIIPDEELARQQAESMIKIYEEERRRKYLQELQDMSNRRHTDNFISNQKSPIPLNRYDEFNADLPEPVKGPKTVAKALFTFSGESTRELSFKKGDYIYIRRQIDSNWYEGEHNGVIGLLPVNYVEIIAKDGIRKPTKKLTEGQARAKFNFQAQSAVELSLNKGELVTLTRRVDDNWFEGKVANRKGIFPVAYVEVLTDIGASTEDSLVHNNNVSVDKLRTTINSEIQSMANRNLPNGFHQKEISSQKIEELHVDTDTRPIVYRALYKYRPQNNDELDLQEGDLIHVLEKCDDGWYVGTSQRTGCFGTFPGNYVERV